MPTFYLPTEVNKPFANREQITVWDELIHLAQLTGDEATRLELKVVLETTNPVLIALAETWGVSTETPAAPTFEYCVDAEQPAAESDAQESEAQLNEPVGEFTWMLPHGQTCRDIRYALKTKLRTGDRVRHITKGEFIVTVNKKGLLTVRPVSEVNA